MRSGKTRTEPVPRPKKPIVRRNTGVHIVSSDSKKIDTKAFIRRRPEPASGHYHVHSIMLPSPHLKTGDKVVVATRMWASCKHVEYEEAERIVGVGLDQTAAAAYALKWSRAGEDSWWLGDPVYTTLVLQEWQN